MCCDRTQEQRGPDGLMYKPCSHYRVKAAMNIGELARAADTKAETIRYYERIGLLAAPPRTAGNYRHYSAAHVSRLIFTRRARDLGFSIEQVRALLAMADQREQSCEAVDIIARKHLADVKRKLADLSALRRELEATDRAVPPRHRCGVPYPGGPRARNTRMSFHSATLSGIAPLYDLLDLPFSALLTRLRSERLSLRRSVSSAARRTQARP